jgi:hypothetical protein
MGSRGALWVCVALAAFAQGSCQRKAGAVREEDLKGVVRTRFDSPQPTPAQLARRSKNTAFIKLAGLPTMDELPVVEDEAKLEPRPKEEIASRCLATEICALKGESDDQKLIASIVARWHADSLFSPKERAFVDDAMPTEQALADFAWGYEHVHVLLWALGYLRELKAPNAIADVPKETVIVRDEGTNLARDAKPRPLSEILDAADLYYRLHWAEIELRQAGKKSDKVNGEIIQERHKALNWLIRYMGQAWDDVKTDT